MKRKIESETTPSIKVQNVPKFAIESMFHTLVSDSLNCIEVEKIELNHWEQLLSLEAFNNAIKTIADKKNKPVLISYAAYYQNIYPINIERNQYISKEDLVQVFNYKITRGKFRPLLKLIMANDEKTIIEVSKSAIILLKQGKILESITALTKLSGVGPATSSILLAALDGNVPFMDDSVLELIVGQRKYTLNEFEIIKKELTKEKETLDGDITKLREGLSDNTTTQSVDRKTGQLITKANNANRKSFEIQLSEAQVRRDTISKRIDIMNDSITKLDVQVLDMESAEISGSELGAIKYVSELLDWNIKKTANLFILILIFVFDPLAITLVIATNQAFKIRKKDETPQVLPDNSPSTDQVTTKYRLSNDEVIDEKNVEKLTDLQKEANRVWEKVNQLKEEGKLFEPTEEEILEEPTALAFTPYEIEENLETSEETFISDGLEEIIEIVEVGNEKVDEPNKSTTKRLIYTKKDV